MNLKSPSIRIQRALASKGMLWILLALAVGLFVLTSFPNHYFFRTYALDLGMFNHALFDFARLRGNTFMLSTDGSEVPYLGDHFSPITWLYGPLSFLFGSWTLLIIQVGAIAVGGIGIYRYAQARFGMNHWIPAVAMLQFFGGWGIYSALSFDFHNNVIAAMMLPWLILMHERKHWKGFLVFFLIILLSKENMALWLVFIMASLSISTWLNHGFFSAKKEIMLMLFSAVYFTLVTGWIMPALREGEGMDQLSRFANYGKDLPSILFYLITHPGQLLSDVFSNHLGEPVLNGIKEEFNFMFLVSGGILLAFRPLWLLMLLPVYLSKMLSADHALWGIGSQYSIEFIPVISLGLIDFLSSLKRNEIRGTLLIAACLSSWYFTVDKMKSRKTLWYEPTNTNPFHPSHYKGDFSWKDVQSVLAQIPDDAVVCSGSALAPHLAFRERIYLFPNVKDAEYIVLLLGKTSSYPIHPDDYERVIGEWKNNADWQVIEEEHKVLILKRKGLSGLK